MDFAYADELNQAVRLLSLRHRTRAAALLAPLGLHPGQEVLLLELARTGPMIQARISQALGCEPPSVTIMTRKLEAAGHIRRTPDVSDKRASVVELTDGGRALAEQVKQVWVTLAEETVAGLPAGTATELPSLLTALTRNIDTRRPADPVGAAGLAGEYEPSGLAWVRDHVDQVHRTGTTDGVTIKDLPTVLMTYRGAKTGKLRKTPVMRVEHEGRYAAVASNGGTATNPQWFAGVLAEPVVAIQDGRTTHTYRAREVLGDEKAQWWARAVDAYPDYAEYQRNTDRRIPVLVLEPLVEDGRAGSTRS
ncbi:nitroreductase/quinone reductase family protein [Embleya scabrispora]|uniref:nitroreductase/quinone reductase family protein n=1 Tax=Embleya scabrispora TaxID=159449 RepID=UPI00036BD0B6|nr:nitroreductase family deazaflavin-dependent oxidoreductase [Streptomyces sp. SID5474]